MKTGKATGRHVTHYTVTAAEVEVEGGCSYPDVVQVDGVAYYVFDFGGVWAGSRTVTGVDAGGNEVHSTRTAPGSTMGVAAPVQGMAVRHQYGDVEVFFRD